MVDTIDKRGFGTANMTKSKIKIKLVLYQMHVCSNFLSVSCIA